MVIETIMELLYVYLMILGHEQATWVMLEHLVFSQ